MGIANNHDWEKMLKSAGLILFQDNVRSFDVNDTQSETIDDARMHILVMLTARGFS